MGKRSRAIAQRRTQRERRRAAEDAGRLLIGIGCLFCRRTDRPFSSVEHILPESMGNREWTLPAGVVCDTCNNGALAAAEKDLCEFFPIKAVRTLTATKNKKGRYPEFRFGAGTMQHDGETLRIMVNDDDDETLKEVGRDGNVVRLRTNIRSDRPISERSTRRVASAMLKAALELAVNDCPELAYSPSLDYVRRQVLGDPWSGMVIATRNHGPFMPDVRLTYDFSFDHEKVGLWVALDYRGLLMLTHSGIAEPHHKIDSEKALVFKFTAAGSSRSGARQRRESDVKQNSARQAPR